MYIIDVIPIAKGIGLDYLSYYTTRTITPGDIVRVPLRSKTATALVVACSDAKQRKTELRRSSFTIKKADRPAPKRFLTDATVRAAREAARYFATSPGRVLERLIPNAVLDQLPSKQFEPATATVKPAGTDHYVLQTQPDERQANYKSLIREEFAAGRSIFFTLPTIEDIYKTRALLEKGIEQYTYVLHSSLTKKQTRDAWRAILQADHPVLIIATPGYLGLPVPNLGTLIVEHENASQYKQQNTPYLDMRRVAEYIAREHGIRLILGDTLLSIETQWRHAYGHFQTYTPIKYRSLTSATGKLIDMREEQGADTAAGFRVISDELADSIQTVHTDNERMFIYTSRRGISPVTVCNDCGTPVRCPHCETPLVLHEPPQGEDHNFFQCHRCGFLTSAHTTCGECGSWKLAALGIGNERVAESVRQLIPHDRVFVLTRDNARTHKQAKEIVGQFYATPGSILVGTEMGMLYLSEMIERIAVASLDSLFAIPDFRINERIMHTLTTMRLISQKQLLVQTRQPEQPVLSHGLSGDLLNFYRSEIEVREQFRYPPFRTFIKITRRGKRAAVERDMRKLEEQLGTERLTIYPSSRTTAQRYVMNALLMIPREQWVDEELLYFLRSLPRHFIVDVDPIDTL